MTAPAPPSPAPWPPPWPAAAPPLEGLAWRLDHARHAATWDSGEGAARVGGRWNSRGTRAVYAALDAATAILEVAVHKGFRVLDTEPHVLTAIRLAGPLHVVTPAEVANPHWLRPGPPTAGQQEFGDALLARHGGFAIPSVVAAQSWTLVLEAGRAGGLFALAFQHRFALDPRLQPAG